MSDKLTKAAFTLAYDDGVIKIEVSFDRNSEHCADSIQIEMGSNNWLYVERKDIPWLIGALQKAAAL